MYEKLGFRPVKELDSIYDKRYWLYRLNLGYQSEHPSYVGLAFLIHD